MAETLEKKHERIMLRFDRAYTPQQDVREKCIEATRFARVPGGQWEGATAAGTKLDDRFEKYPKFEINKVATELNRIIAEYRNNRITVKFRPGDKEASEELANKLNGLFRADYEETDGGEACDNAFDDAATGGFGCFRLTSMLVNEYDPMDERQRIAIEPVYDPSRSVWFDPDAKKYDKSDALWAFCMYSLSPEKYEAEYGKTPPASLDVTTMTSWEYDWFEPEVVYIAKYYEVRKESVDVISYRQPITGEIATYDSDQIEDIEDELALAGFQEVARRSVKRRRVYVSVVDGQNFLEKPRRIPGEHIPLIPVYGKRWFIDDIERVEGHIAKAMDPQRLYNLQVSMLADSAAQDPGQVPIFDPEQVRGLEKHWEDRGKKRPAFLVARAPRDKSGNPIGPAAPGSFTPAPQLSPAIATMLQLTSADIQEVTGSSQAMQQMPSNIAQETVNNLMNRADMASFIYLDNMAKSLKRAGEVWLSMAREVYGSEREVRVVNEDGTDDIALMNAQVVDSQTGRVVALNDLSTGRYDVTVDVGPSYTARRDATVSVLTNVLSTMLPNDPMRPAIQGIILDNIDGEGLDDFKEYNRNQLLTSGIVKPRNEKEQQIVMQAQQAAANQQNPEMVLAQAQMVAAQAEAQKATNETAQTQIKAFTAQQDAMESQANTVYKLAQARNIDDKAVMEAIRLLKDVSESQQSQIPTSPQSPADLMPS
ncbi:portal protein [Salmonella enterica subsp. enterica serovar Thompson]|uniref:Portal protein n=3 Tax=Salmonella enterica TaxID=28901 RepID=A0A5U6FDP7_SALET|nr:MULTISPECIES: portal protein [Salmonella]EAA3674051.1 portal protein [Salmonella enterica subsp. enterica serovar Braenderup]EBG0107140.1 portal protein [Salmonella enterica subsp. enterica serovar Virchow]EBQ6229100.1 portal protein [Salmonella enterica subsp. enterica serovar Newport]EBQ8900460.1 portal protein [Salmonella enterica subsp. enterica serovar Agona]EBW6338225.1 portal protein [Salmonella enterica subsp. enterica serovar Oslo]EBX9145384.1 portal protein [Salmonella enterica s